MFYLLHTHVLSRGSNSCLRAIDKNRYRADRQCFHDIAAATNAAIHPDFDFSIDRESYSAENIN